MSNIQAKMLWTLLFVALSSWSANGSSVGSRYVSDHCGEPADHSSFRVDYEFYAAANGWLKLHRIPAPWTEAHQTCFLEGAHLASPITEGLAMVMRTFVQEAQLPTIHTGIHSMVSVEEYYSIEGVPLSGIPITWAANEPNNFNNSERCLTMNSQGAMADADCKALRPFFCYKKKDGVSTMNKCGYHDKTYQVDPLSGHCYKLYETPMTWYQGLTRCSAEGGTLAVINSEAEAKFIEKLAQQNAQKWVWLGFYRSWFPKLESWQTMNGNTLKEAGFERWKKGEPNNYGGQEYCGSFVIEKSDGILELNDMPCNATNLFVCEIPLLTEKRSQ